MNRLRELRKKNKYTLDDIEPRTGIKRGTYNNYESGKTNPKPETWQKLADFYGVSVPYLQGAYSKEELIKIYNNLVHKRIDYLKKARVLFKNSSSENKDNEFLNNVLLTLEETVNLLLVTVGESATTFSKDESIIMIKLMDLQKVFDKIRKYDPITKKSLVIDETAYFDSSMIKNVLNNFIKLYTTKIKQISFNYTLFNHFVPAQWLMKYPGISATTAEIEDIFQERANNYVETRKYQFTSYIPDWLDMQIFDETLNEELDKLKDKYK